MASKSWLASDFFQSIHEKESYHETILDPKQVRVRISQHLILLLLFSMIYGIVMGCFNGFAQAISSGVKVPVLRYFDFG